MLILTFREGEECFISFPGQPLVKVRVLDERRRGQTRLGFIAPKNVSIDRETVYQGKKRDGTL